MTNEDMEQLTHFGAWREIEGWQDYLIDSGGRIVSFRTGGNASFMRVSKSGKVRLCRGYGENKERQYLSVGKLVLRAFMGPCPDGCVVVHHDDDLSNNCVSNLSYQSRSRVLKRAFAIRDGRATA